MDENRLGKSGGGLAMAKPYDTLREKMSPEARARADEQAADLGSQRVFRCP